MACSLLSPLLQFGNSGGPLVNLVSPPLAPLLPRAEPCRCPSVGAPQCQGAAAAGREGLCVLQAPREEELVISPAREPHAVSFGDPEPMRLWGVAGRALPW